MTARSIIRTATFLGIVAVSQPTHAFFFILPIPNFAKPAPLSSLIDALEKSEETKAVAYVSEDKLFGSKYWVWGHFAGHVPQAEADRVAMSRCGTALTNAKAQAAGGKTLYDYGTKTCELYSFANKAVSPRAGEWQPTPAAIPAPVPPAPAPPPVSPNVEPSPQPSTATPSSPPSSAPAETPPKPAAGASTPTASGGAQPSQPQPQGQVTPESPTAKKLRELEALRKEGLITETEYQEKRKAILAAM